MSRIATPKRMEDALPAAQPLLQEVQNRLSRVPNMFLTMAKCPAALQGFLNLSNALNQGSIGATMREQIALAVAESNGCDYCLSAHTYLARRALRDDAEITANRSGASNDMQTDAVLRFAAKIAQKRGHVSDSDVIAFTAAGYSDAAVLEVTMLVALCTLTNYVNEVTGTDIDFPVIRKRTARVAA